MRSSSEAPLTLAGMLGGTTERAFVGSSAPIPAAILGGGVGLEVPPDADGLPGGGADESSRRVIPGGVAASAVCNIRSVAVLRDVPAAGHQE